MVGVWGGGVYGDWDLVRSNKTAARVNIFNSQVDKATFINASRTEYSESWAQLICLDFGKYFEVGLQENIMDS